ncbi:MAG: GspE/PulE family protein [Myxococcota bacterium]
MTTLPNTLSNPRSFTLEYLTRLLVERNELTVVQRRQALEREKVTRAQLLKTRVSGVDARRADRITISPTEVLSSFEYLTPQGRLVDEDVIMSAVAEDVGLPFEKPDPLKLDAELITATMRRPYARRHSCVPLRRHDGHIVLAIHDPFDVRLREDLVRLLGEQFTFVLSGRADIQRIITEVYGFRSSVSAAAERHGSTGLSNLEQLTQLTSLEKLEATDRPVVSAVEFLLHYAFDQRASDIHIEPKRERSVVRMRIDGALHNVYTLPKAVHAPLTSRLKMLGRMDIAEKRRPQDGRIKTAREEREIELRVSSMPVAFGEKLVIRIFDSGSIFTDLTDLGFFPDEFETWNNFIHRPHGMVLITGPTGSGKTTTLYSTLRELAGPDVNITTVEDPIEMVYEEFNQVLVQRRIDLGFGAALRTILRQDPDIIMIGEIRDEETAKMAVQAALTGHLVFSTLHTNDTSSAVTRLIDLGVEPFLLSSTLVGVAAQRLVRRVCTSCKVQTELRPEQLDLLGLPLDRTGRTYPVYYGEGCLRCRGTGYYGRVGVFELMPIDPSIRKLVHDAGDATEIRKAARANKMMSLSECAIRKMALGETTFEEVMSVLTV